MLITLNLPEVEYRRYTQYYKPYVVEQQEDNCAKLIKLEITDILDEYQLRTAPIDYIKGIDKMIDRLRKLSNLESHLQK